MSKRCQGPWLTLQSYQKACEHLRVLKRPPTAARTVYFPASPLQAVLNITSTSTIMAERGGRNIATLDDVSFLLFYNAKLLSNQSDSRLENGDRAAVSAVNLPTQPSKVPCYPSQPLSLLSISVHVRTSLFGFDAPGCTQARMLQSVSTCSSNGAMGITQPWPTS